MRLRDEEITAHDEQQLVKRAQQGDRGALKVIVEVYERRVLTSIYRLVGDRETAQDLCQETFVRALKALKGYAGRARVSTWLLTIALNVTKSYWSSRTFAERKSSDSFDPERHAQTDRGAEWAETELRLLRLRRAIAKLQPLHQEVIVLCWLEQRSYDEVAEVLGIPYGTVCSRLHAGLKVLRTLMQDEEEG